MMHRLDDVERLLRLPADIDEIRASREFSATAARMRSLASNLQRASPSLT